MRPIKFRYMILNTKTSEMELRCYTLLEIEKGLKLGKGELFGSSRDLFTGLKDCKKVEIYEGDLMRDLPGDYEPREILEVFWDDKMDGFQLRGVGENHLYQTPLDEKMKVIGNVYENEDLLK